MAMRRSKLRSAWGLALAVLFGGSVARAEPPPSLRPRRRERDYALVGANPNWGPVGVIKNLDGGFDSGARFGVGYHWCGGYEAIFQYTHFHTAGDDQVTAGDTARLGVQVFPTLTHP